MSGADFAGGLAVVALLCAAVPLGLVPAVRAARQEARRRRCVGRVLAAHRKAVAEREAEVAPRHPVGWPVRLVDGLPYALSPDGKTVHRYSRAACGWLSCSTDDAARVRSEARAL